MCKKLWWFKYFNFIEHFIEHTYIPFHTSGEDKKHSFCYTGLIFNSACAHEVLFYIQNPVCQCKIKPDSGCPDAQGPESHQEFRLSPALLWAWESSWNTRCFEQYILDIKSQHFIYWTVAFKYFVLSHYNESYFGCNSSFNCLNKHSTITLQLERGENSSHWSLFYFLFYTRPREEGFFHIKRKSNAYSTILRRKKDQAEHGHANFQSIVIMWCVLSAFFTLS